MTLPFHGQGESPIRSYVYGEDTPSLPPTIIRWTDGGRMTPEIFLFPKSRTSGQWRRIDGMNRGSFPERGLAGIKNPQATNGYGGARYHID